MALQGGNLLLNRRRITIPGSAVNFPIDTFLRQVGLGMQPDPPLGGIDPVDAPPNGIPSRVMVVPLSPFAPWALITHKEPILDVATGTVRVDFTNGGVADVILNVLFWDPHTSICPVSANTYQPPFIP